MSNNQKQTLQQQDNVISLYEQFKKSVKKGHYTKDTSKIIGDIFKTSLLTIKTFGTTDLTSSVQNKEYFAFTHNSKKSRAINKNLYSDDYQQWDNLNRLMTSNSLDRDIITPEEITKTIYSIAITFCAVIDLIKKSDQKTPGTFFEYLIAHFFTWRVGIEPKNAIQVLNLDDDSLSLPTDFVSGQTHDPNMQITQK